SGCMLLFVLVTDTAPHTTYTLSLHDALPILPSASSMATTRAFGEHQTCSMRIKCGCRRWRIACKERISSAAAWRPSQGKHFRARSEEHTSELQSPCNLVCRLLLEKKKTTARK